MPMGIAARPIIHRLRSKPLKSMEGVAVYLLYNGILKDKSVDGGNVLTAPVPALLPPHDGPKLPYFCLRVPTGGGKTRLAARAVELRNSKLLRTEHSVILWLVPSNAIREQTYKALRNREHPYHHDLRLADPDHRDRSGRGAVAHAGDAGQPSSPKASSFCRSCFSETPSRK